MNDSALLPLVKKPSMWEEDGKWYIETVNGQLRIGKQTPRLDIFKDGLIVQAKEAFTLVKDYGNPL